VRVSNALLEVRLALSQGHRLTRYCDSYFDPEEVPAPPVPVPPEVPDAPEEPVAPEELDVPGEPLAPELWSPARRSQPTAVRLNAARTNKIFDEVLSAFILVPFTKKVSVVSYLTISFAISS